MFKKSLKSALVVSIVLDFIVCLIDGDFSEFIGMIPALLFFSFFPILIFNLAKKDKAMEKQKYIDEENNKGMKFDVEVSFGDDSDLVELQILDDEMNIMKDEEKTNIKFCDIKSYTLSKNKLILQTEHHKKVEIMTNESKNIHSFINLWKKSTKITKMSDTDSFEKIATIFIVCLVLGIIFFFIKTESFGYAVVYSFLSSLPLTAVINVAFKSIYNKKIKCPNCDANMKILIGENKVGKIKCDNCNKLIGVKFDRFYKLNPEIEDEFED